jgi:hypothetical protein
MLEFAEPGIFFPFQQTDPDSIYDSTDQETPSPFWDSHHSNKAASHI